MYVFTNKRSKQLYEMIIVDAAYYANWLSIVYGLKDRLLKNLLVFLPKIEDLTFLTLVCLQTKGKREKWLSFAPKPPVREDKAYRWLFRRMGLQNQRWIHGFWGWFLWLYKGRILLRFWVRISDSFAAKRENRQIWFGSALAKPSLFLPLLGLL